MGRIGFRSVRAHAARFVMSVLAVALGVAFVTGTFSLREMLSSTFDELVNASSTADAYIQPPTTASSAELGPSGALVAGVPLALADEVREVDGVAAVVPGISGPATLVGADGTAVRSTQAPSMVMPFYPDDPGMGTLTGRLPQDPSEIVLEQHTLESSGLAIGDTTKVVLLGEVTDVTVVGSTDFNAPMAGATIILMDPATVEAAFAPSGLAETLAVYAQEGVSEQQLVERIAPLAPEGTEAVTGTAMRADLKDAIAGELGFISTFLLVFALLALFVGAFIIANTFTMSVRQRMREFALLRAVGGSPTQVFSSIVIQALVIGVVGSALGVLGGFGLVTAIGSLFRQMDMSLSSSVPLSASTIVTGVAVGVLVSVLAAALPARRAALVPPVEAMRDEVTVNEKSLRVRGWAGLALVVAGAAALVVAAVRPDADEAGSLLGLGAAGLIIGTLVVGPVVVPAVVRWLAAPAVAWLRPVGRLARGNVVRNPRRAASTAGALTIGMALVGASAVLAASTTASMRSVVDSEMHADFVLRTEVPDTVARSVVDQVAALDDVEKTYPAPWSMVSMTTDDGEEQGPVAGLDPSMIGTVFTPLEIVGPAAEVLASGGAVADIGAAEANGWHIGDEVTVTTAEGSRTFTVGAMIRSVAMGTSLMVAPSVLDEMVPPGLQTNNTVMVVAAPGTDLEVLRGEMTQIVAPLYVVSVQDAEQFVDGLAAQVNQMLYILYALLGLSVAIAVLGIVNTLALSVIERTREIGLLRAVGLGRFQMSGVITTESVLTAVCGTAIGLGLGIGIASTFPRLFRDEGMNTLSIPAGSLAGMLGLAVVVGVIAAVWPAIRASRLPVLEAISQD